MMPLAFGINSDEGCELKHVGLGVKVLRGLQLPSSGCELKPTRRRIGGCPCWQPPSGGCELKLNQQLFWLHQRPAAFERV